MQQEESSILVSGVKTPKTRYSNPTHTDVKSFPSIAGACGVTPPTTNYPKDSRLICSLPPGLSRINSVNGEESDNTSNESMPAIHSRPHDCKNNPFDHTNEEAWPINDEDVFSHNPLLGRDEREESSEEGVACELSEGQKTTPKVDRSKKPVKGKKLGAYQSINGDDDQGLPLLDEGTNRRNRHCTICKLVIVGIIFFVFVSIHGLGLASPILYQSFTAVFAHYDIDPPQSTPAVQGDYVLLPYVIHRGTMFQYTLNFSLNTDDTDLSTNEVDIYCIEPDELSKVTKMANFNGVSSKGELSSTPFFNRIYFSDCQYSSKCVIGQFVYQAKTGLSHLAFNITLNNYTAGYTEIDAIVFDSYEDFRNFLHELDCYKVKDIQINQQSFYFELTEAEVRRSSYYFFVVADLLKDTSSWFTMQPSGIHKYYNASSQPVCCTMNTTNDFSCSFNGTRHDSVTYLAHVRGDKVRGIPTEDQLFYITSSVSDPLPTIAGQVIMWLCFSVVVIVVMLIAGLIIKKIILKRADS